MLSNQSHAGDDVFDYSKLNEKFEWCNVEKSGLTMILIRNFGCC